MPLIGRLQRRHIEALQTLQPGRKILVQPKTVDDANQKETRWVALDAVPPDVEIWTRSVLLNEVLFDADAKPWSRVADATARLVSALDELGIPHYTGPSGGKGAHASVFFDPTTIRGPSDLLARAERLGVDLFSEARMVLANCILNAAGFPDDDAKRWAPPIGESGVWDRSKIKWSAARMGSMVRVLGCRGRAGFRKTVAPWDAEAWRRSAANEAPPELGQRFHYDVQSYELPRTISDMIIEQVERAVATAEATKASTRPTVNPFEAVKALKAVPCAARILTSPAPPGTRHYAFLNLAVTAKHLGVPRAGARSLLQQALALCDLSDTDPAVQVLEEVYDGRYRLMNMTCPSPHVKSWCDPNGCALACRFEF